MQYKNTKYNEYFIDITKNTTKIGSAQQKMHRACFIPSADLHCYQVFLRQYVLPPAHSVVQVQHSEAESLPAFQCYL